MDAVRHFAKGRPHEYGKFLGTACAVPGQEDVGAGDADSVPLPCAWRCDKGGPTRCSAQTAAGAHSQ